MEIKFDDNQPIYLQIMTRFKRMLASGLWQPGERIASVRDLALEYGVNPNTMQKALSELERAGYLHSERTAGRLVTEDEPLIKALKQEEQLAAVRRFVEELTALGMKREEIPALLEIHLKNQPS